MLGASLNSENAHRKHKSTKNTPLNTSEKDWFTVQELKQEGRTCEETFCPALHMSVKVPPTSIGFGVQGEIQQVGETANAESTNNEKQMYTPVREEARGCYL